MAFSRRDAEPISSTSLAEPPTHFFKVILPATLEEKKLRIPEAFVRKFGDELSAVVTLTVPNGRTWHVQLTKDKKKICFHYGWHEFVKYHSISAGYFLVFQYGKNSNFHVLIFDQTAGEIQYPYYCGVLEQNSNHDEMRIYDKAVDKCRRSSSKLYTSPSQLNRCGKCGASFETPKFTHPNNPDSSTHNELEEGIEKDTKFHKSASPRKRTRMTVERERAFNAAKAFEPDNPFCRVVLRPSYLHKKCFMYFPSYFAKKHLKGVSGLIKLQTCDGKQRPVRCVYRGDSAKLTHGWYEFTLENNLEEGDVCIFEMLRSGDIVLKVTVFRVLETAQFVNQPSSDSAPGSTMFQKRITSHENPKFRHGIDVASKRCKIEELDEIDKSDAVGDEVEAHSSDEENGIKKIYKLELLLEDQGIFVHRKFGSHSAEERERASTAARLLKPKYPSFMVILQPYNLKYYAVHVPAKFGNKYLSHDSKCIEVQDSEGREWPLLLIFHHGFSIKGRARFYREMNLSEGDVCIFELIRVKEPRLKVSVFNASTK